MSTDANKPSAGVELAHGKMCLAGKTPGLLFPCPQQIPAKEELDDAQEICEHEGGKGAKNCAAGQKEILWTWRAVKAKDAQQSSGQDALYLAALRPNAACRLLPH